MGVHPHLGTYQDANGIRAGCLIEDQTLDPWCSIITVTYNSRAALEEFWSGAHPMPLGVEWIVVDNGSIDGSADLARSLGATVVIERNANLGFSSSNNVGFRAARGAFIGFVNPDIRMDFSDLSELNSVAEAKSAIVSPQLMNADSSLQPNGRGFPLLGDKIRNRLGDEARLLGQYLLYAESSEPRAVCWLMGASIFATRATFERIDAWDPHFFLYYEDKDICLRAWKAGFSVLLVPTAQWAHGWARETKSASATPWKREIASMVKFYGRYPEFLLGKKVAARVNPRIDAAVFGYRSKNATRSV